MHLGDNSASTDAETDCHNRQRPRRHISCHHWKGGSARQLGTADSTHHAKRSVHAPPVACCREFSEMCLEMNTWANIVEANSKRRVGLSQDQHLADALRGVPPTTPICEARDIALCHLQSCAQSRSWAKMATARLYTLTLPPTETCQIVRFTPLRSVQHKNCSKIIIWVSLTRKKVVLATNPSFYSHMRWRSHAAFSCHWSRPRDTWCMKPSLFFSALFWTNKSWC